jgi:hypothetical protein
MCIFPAMNGISEMSNCSFLIACQKETSTIDAKEDSDEAIGASHASGVLASGPSPDHQ